ncbi:MAG: TRAP transporter small permease [Planctomycetales bacterium]|nr:TRAP transporter small permease [Planctomycetales bacterium]MCA9168244.1 TRAP transporter small permease [Planctomycetales bacterium]
MRTARIMLTQALELAVTVIVGILVLDVLWGVLSRFALGRPSPWTEELATFLLMWVALLGAAVALSRKSHLGVDFFVQQLHPDAQRLLAICVQALVACFAISAMVYGGIVLVRETLQSGQVTPALGIRMGFVYLAMPIAGVFITLFSIEQALELIRGDAPETSCDVDDRANDPCHVPSTDAGET